MIAVGTKSGVLLLSPKQAAESLGILPRKLWSMTACGEIPHLKIGRLTRYCIDDLRAFIDANKRGGKAGRASV